MAVLSTPPLLLPLRTRNVILVSGLIALVYLLTQALLLNFSLLSQTLGSSSPLSYKLHLTLSLLTGFLLMFPLQQLIFMIITAIMVGLNFALLIAVIQNVKRNGTVKMSFGGMSVLALASSGCPSCGLSLLSLLGPSTGILGVALHSTVAQGAIIGLLAVSIIYSLKKLQTSLTCQR